MQNTAEIRSTASEYVSGDVISGLSKELNKIAQHVRPGRFRAQFGTRYGTLLGATGLDWNLTGEKALDQPDTELETNIAGAIVIPVRFDKSQKYLSFTPCLPELSAKIIETVLASLHSLVQDWRGAVARNGEAVPNADADQFTISATSASKHLPPLLPARFTHKLRNYLTPVISGAGQIQEIAEVEQTADQATMAEIVLAGARRQEQLIERFVQTFGPLDIQPAQIDFSELLRSIFSAYRSRGVRTIDFAESPGEVICYQDDNLLRIIISEVVNNALETGSENPIAITFSHDDEIASVQVVNSAMATIAEIEKNFFTPFYSRKANHDGLGLPLARRLARELGGDLRCTTSTDAICFEIEIPRNLNRF